jgi:hypothetical protein
MKAWPTHWGGISQDESAAMQRSTRCPYDNCVEWLTEEGRRDGGFGPITCPCDHTPGWRSEWIEGMGKPRPAVLPKGRHRSRVQRSISRHRIPIYVKELERRLHDGE